MTPNELIQLADLYCQRSTRKRETMSPQTARLIKGYARELAEALCAIPRGDGRAVVHATHARLATLKPSSARTVASLFGGFLVYAGLLTQDEQQLLCRLFRPSRYGWSTKALDEDISVTLARETIQTADPALIYIVFLMASLGLRVGQATTLRREDVLRDGDLFHYHVIRQKNADQSLSRKSLYATTAFGSLTLADIHAQWQAWAATNLSVWAFPGTGKGPISQETVRRHFRAFSERHHIRVTPHMLRHTVGTNITMALGIAHAAALLDHADVRTTQRYVDVTSVDISADIVRDASRIKERSKGYGVQPPDDPDHRSHPGSGDLDARADID